MSEKAAHAKRRSTVEPMVITTVTYNGFEITVNWQRFVEDKLVGFVVSVLHVDVGLNNFPVDDPDAVSKVIGYVLKAGDTYQVWVTPLLKPGYPDYPNQSNVASIPYPPARHREELRNEC